MSRLLLIFKPNGWVSVRPVALPGLQYQTCFIDIKSSLGFLFVLRIFYVLKTKKHFSNWKKTHKYLFDQQVIVLQEKKSSVSAAVKVCLIWHVFM